MKKVNLVSAFCLYIFGMITSVTAFATTPVAIAPVAKQFFVDKTSGAPLSFGCVFTYSSGSTTPLTSYTDATGSTPNTNPIILTAAGFAGTSGSTGLFLKAGVAYTIKVVSAGGSNCISGTTQYTIDGIGAGNSLTTTVSTCTGTCPSIIAGQVQLFQITLTGNATADPLSAVGIIPPGIVFYQITQDSSGAHTFVFPSNSVGGCSIDTAANAVSSQEFYWDGSKAYAISGCMSGTTLKVGALIAAGNVTANQLISTIATGTAPLVVASTTRVANLNVSLLEDANWESPGQIGSVTPNNGAFSSFRVGGGTIQTATQGTDVHLQTAGTVAASSPIVCIDSLGGTTTTCTTTGPVFAPQRVVQGAGSVSISANTQTIILTESVTFPSAPGTYRADIRYSQWITSGPNICGTLVVDTTNSRAFAFTQQNANGSGFNGYSASEISSQTYAAGATATFTLQAQCNAGSTATQKNGAAFTYSPDPSSYLSVTPVLSN